MTVQAKQVRGNEQSGVVAVSAESLFENAKDPTRVEVRCSGRSIVEVYLNSLALSSNDIANTRAWLCGGLQHQHVLLLRMTLVVRSALFTVCNVKRIKGLESMMGLRDLAALALAAAAAVIGLGASMQANAQGGAINFGTITVNPDPNAGDTVTLPTMTVRATRYYPTGLTWDVTSNNTRTSGSSNYYDETMAYVEPSVGYGKDAGEKSCDRQIGNPIVFSTGNKIEKELDFVTQGEMQLFLERTYNARSDRGLFGPRWLSSFDFKIRAKDEACVPKDGAVECTIIDHWPSNESIIAERPDGQKMEFKQDNVSGRQYVGAPGSLPRLDWQPTDGTWLLYTRDHTIERYSRGGFILENKNEHGVGWTFSYGGLNGTQLQRVTHTSGRYVQLGWSGYLLTSVTDPAGNSYLYTYAGGVLQSASLPGGTQVAYHYQGSAWENWLAGKSYNGVRYSTFSYGDGGAIRSEHAGGVERYDFVYTLGQRYVENYGYVTDIVQTVVTNPLGKQTTYKFHAGQIAEVIGHPSTNCPGSFMKRTYDSWGFADRVVDFVGNVTDYDYNKHGYLQTKVEAYGTPMARSSTYVWDEAKNRKVKVAVAGIAEITYGYTANGRVASVATKDQSTGQTRTTTYSYANHANGLLASVVVDAPGTLSDVTLAYSTTGDLLTVTNANSQVTTYSEYNGLGQPGRITSPSGAVVEYEYDARGRVVVERTFPNGSPVVTRYVYGTSGLLDAKTTSDGNDVFYHYDAARRLIQEDLTEPGGGFAVKRYTYDAMSNPIKIEIGREN